MLSLRSRGVQSCLSSKSISLTYIQMPRFKRPTKPAGFIFSKIQSSTNKYEMFPTNQCILCGSSPVVPLFIAQLRYTIIFGCFSFYVLLSFNVKATTRKELLLLRNQWTVEKYVPCHPETISRYKAISHEKLEQMCLNLKYMFQGAIYLGWRVAVHCN